MQLSFWQTPKRPSSLAHSLPLSRGSWVCPCVHIYIYIHMVRPPPPWCLGVCLLSVIQVILHFLARLGHQGRGCATILQLRILDPRLLGGVQCDNLKFNIQDLKTIFCESWNVESCVPYSKSDIWDSRFKIPRQRIF